MVMDAVSKEISCLSLPEPREDVHFVAPPFQRRRQFGYVNRDASYRNRM